MAKIIYSDTLNKDGTEGLNLTFDQLRTVEAGQMLKAAVAWFELATGGVLIKPLKEEPTAKVIPITPAAKPGRKPRRTKAEMAAAKLAGNGPDNEATSDSTPDPFQEQVEQPTAEIHEIGPASVTAPSREDVRFVAESWLGERGPEGEPIFKEMLVAQGADPVHPKISQLDDAGLSVMMSLLMQASADG